MGEQCREIQQWNCTGSDACADFSVLEQCSSVWVFPLSLSLPDLSAPPWHLKQRETLACCFLDRHPPPPPPPHQVKLGPTSTGRFFFWDVFWEWDEPKCILLRFFFSCFLSRLLTLVLCFPSSFRRRHISPQGKQHFFLSVRGGIISYRGCAACQAVTEAPSLITHILPECGKKGSAEREKERTSGSGVIRADSVSVLPVASHFNTGSLKSARVELL